jgi:hypothetical protein
VETALAGVNARAGDQVKSQSGFAEYTDAGWKGSLKDMQPGAGYMYLSNASTAGTFTYPGAPAPLPMERKNAGPTVEPRWTADRHRFADNMTVVAIVPDGETEAHGDLLEIAAFSGGECRGSALLQYVEGQDNPYMGFLLISGEAGDRLDFKVYDHGTGKEYNASGPVNTFTVNGIYGHVPNPAAITIRSATGIDPIGGALRIYPNPVTDVLYLECGQGEKYFAPTVEIFDVNGTVHIRRVDFAEPSLRVSHLAPGMYILRITVDGKTFVHKFIKQ